MRLLDRSLLLLTSVIVGFLAIFVAWAAYMPSLIEKTPFQFLEGDFQMQVIVAIIAVLLFLLALRLLWVSVSRSRRGAVGVDHETEIGQVRISIETLESLARKAADRIKGIRELTARVHLHADTGAVHIGFRITVDGDRPFLELSNELQTTVKNQVETIAGIDVDDVSVNIIQTAIKSDRARVRVN
ncbi:Uncharacterized conserved protein YloU, alkaline shock protein (Asp23) family [Seinonella peptonophila]|uniref:Uncharacterized conserved protein YloU, alkaline shock protein (Asp23) family n=1 Tax=Seinonella peptonophila TaxID=112248 RepID=A0A1M4TM97_9BACL|nr:alkaline shock response membrane anchor protein AmaP [Seinonella peptonophila]SHE45609.1 Uncharacterized conserved protein YloU, alkaline shock protein (Asp23) family [Seinonella peptonophila]